MAIKAAAKCWPPTGESHTFLLPGWRDVAPQAPTKIKPKILIANSRTYYIETKGWWRPTNRYLLCFKANYQDSVSDI